MLLACMFDRVRMHANVIHIQNTHSGHLADAFIQSDLQYVQYICQKKEKQQYITVSTVRMFIEPKYQALG